MEKFEDLQALWQSQTGGPAGPGEGLVRDVRRHASHRLRLFAVKTAAVLVWTVFMLVITRDSALKMAGALVAIAGFVVILAVDWWANLRVVRLAYAAPSAGFVHGSIERLRGINSLRGVQFAALILGPLLGVNLMELVYLHDMAWQWRIVSHVLLSVFLIAVAIIGFRFRDRRFERETRPLIDRLEAFEASAGEKPVSE